MRHEIHRITNKGCDQHPKDSLHAVKIDENGTRWTVLGVNSIHPSVTSEKSCGEIIHGRICSNCANTFNYNCANTFNYNCANTFNYNGAKSFVNGICGRCHEKKTKLNRNV